MLDKRARDLRVTLRMLVLSRLRESLEQALVPPELHTAILLSPSGQLICFASYPNRRKDDIRVIAGLSGEVWQETQELSSGMVNSELGRILVMPVDDPDSIPQPLPDDYQPLMLLVLNSTDQMEWEDLQARGRAVTVQIARPMTRFREHLRPMRKPPPMPSALTSPSRAR
ncbi:hypothetical protein MIND_00521800 [Mycena indigotica]|uniref:Uncharacterized protein n=1 Tax=Mycena indigotica TaxID=2126181 RepID=A0A8H6SXQ4_9AGAR|nr:uncharacterized protein MIND_00521800 [Mycena indigotica]KAF7307279.1 hypothetical protein MIND_00521800 [Mycena indigotica]